MMIDPKELSSLYRGSDIQEIWQASQNLPVINHPKFGKISPNQYRAKYNKKPCPFCGKKMVQGDLYKTTSKMEAIKNGYQYIDQNGNKCIHQIGSIYFHPNYISLDHKLNKARLPEKMFDADNLIAICWKCNAQKSDDNHFEIQHDFEYLKDLASETISRYPKL